MVSEAPRLPRPFPYMCYLERVELPQPSSWPALPCSVEDSSDDELAEVGSDGSNTAQYDASRLTLALAVPQV